jgi:LacI family transcriptional regulator
MGSSTPSTKLVSRRRTTSPLAGYDNTTFAAFGPISLTTVDQAGHQMGVNAARLLLDRIADRTKSTAQVNLSPILVARRTTAPPSPRGRI